MHIPIHISKFCDALGIPPDERSERMEIIVNSAFPLEITCANGRWFAAGILNELLVPPDAPTLELFLERPPTSTEQGTTSYEPSRKCLLHWMEINTSENEAALATASFLSELKAILRFAAGAGVL